MNINQIEIAIKVIESNQDLQILEYQIKANGVAYQLQDTVFNDNYQQIQDYQSKLSSQEFLSFIIGRCKVIPINLFRICVSNQLMQSQFKIVDENQTQISELITKSTNESITQCYSIIQQVESQLKRIIYLHQIAMVDSFTKTEQRIEFIQDCLNFLAKYKIQEGTQIHKYIKEKQLFILNDLYRLQSSLLRKDLCQQTLFQLQQQSAQLENQDIGSRIIRLQLDFNQAEYIYGLQNKVQLNMQNIYEILKTLKLLDIYDINQKLLQIPVMVQNDNFIIYQINDNLMKIMQIIFGSLQLQENSLLGELLKQYQSFFQMLPSLQIRYTYHICLSLTLQQQEALDNSLQAFNLALEINDINDIVEIFLNTQLLYIETDQAIEGLKFSQQFLENFGNQKIKQSHKMEYKQIQDNMTYMMVKAKMKD